MTSLYGSNHYSQWHTRTTQYLGIVGHQRGRWKVPPPATLVFKKKTRAGNGGGTCQSFGAPESVLVVHSRCSGSSGIDLKSWVYFFIKIMGWARHCNDCFSTLIPLFLSCLLPLPAIANKMPILPHCSLGCGGDQWRKGLKKSHVLCPPQITQDFLREAEHLHNATWQGKAASRFENSLLQCSQLHAQPR